MSYRNRPAYARFVVVGGALALESSYDDVVVAEIKNLPTSKRRWDKDNKRWLIDPAYANQIARTIKTAMNIDAAVPSVAKTVSLPDIRTIQVDYLGACKDKPEGKIARGLVAGSWDLIFPEAVLRRWFKDGDMTEGFTPEAPSKPKTLYAILGLERTCDQDLIKPAFRRMALHTHPDRNKEPDAREQFQKVQAAYEILGDLNKRRKYDIGLFMEIQQEQQQERADKHYRHDYAPEYRAPLRNGLLIVKGRQQVAGFVVDDVLQWQDVTREDGKVMVSSMQKDDFTGDFKLIIDWVQP